MRLSQGFHLSSQPDASTHSLVPLGGTIVRVQTRTGHATVTTTARYDRRGEELRRRAAELLKVPVVADTA
jgi:hypothetical protein